MTAPDAADSRIDAPAQQRARQLTALRSVTRAIASRQGTEAVFRTVAEAATLPLGALWTRVWVADPAERVLRLQASFGIDPKLEALLTDYTVVPYGEGVAGRVMESCAAAYISDLRDDRRLLNRRVISDGGVRSCAALPLVADDRLVGVLAILFGAPRAFTSEEREVMEALADHAAIAIDTARLVEALTRSADEVATAQRQLLQSQKMEAIGQLAAGVAHDFNNLLTIILGRGELLKARLPADAPAHHDIDLMCGAAARAAQLTRQLLAFSRKQVLQPKVIDANQLLRGMGEMLQRLLPESIMLSITAGAIPDTVRVDPGQLEVVVMNLVINARDAMSDGGAIAVTTAARDFDAEFVRAHPGARPGAYVAVVVEDTGIGMDAATRARAFEPFFTTKPPGQGTGLGLSTVYGIVKQSEGYVTIDSEPGRGTTVTVYLPRPAVAPPVDDDRPRARTVGGPATVLVIEDEATIRAFTCAILRAAGYRVLEARDGTTAVQIVARLEGPLDLLVTDLVLPGPGALDVARQFIVERPGLQVIVTSAYVDPGAFGETLRLPGVHFIAKPFTAEDLTRAVRAILAPADAG